MRPGPSPIRPEPIHLPAGRASPRARPVRLGNTRPAAGAPPAAGRVVPVVPEAEALGGFVPTVSLDTANAGRYRIAP